MRPVLTFVSQKQTFHPWEEQLPQGPTYCSPRGGAEEGMLPEWVHHLFGQGKEGQGREGP